MSRLSIPTTSIRPDGTIRRYRSPAPAINIHIPTINWGSYVPYPTPLHAPCLNPPEYVAAASNKYRSLVVMAAAGVRVPQFWLAHPDPGVRRTTGTQSEFLLTPPTDDFPIPVVPRLNYHRHGQDIINCIAGVTQPHYYTELIPSHREYRIHVARWVVNQDDSPNHIIQSQRKVAPEGEPDRWPRTHHNGYLFRSFVPQNLDADLFRQAVAAVTALGLDFGAVDMIHSHIDGQYYVLEVNTAPSLDTSIEHYSRAFASWSPITPTSLQGVAA